MKMDEKIKLIHNKKAFELLINGNSIPFIERYTLSSNAGELVSLKVEMSIPVQDIDVKVEI